MPDASMEHKIIHAFLSEFIVTPWTNINNQRVAQICGVEEKDLLHHVRGKESFFTYFFKYIETQLFNVLDIPLNQTFAEPDLLLEILLTKLEIMTPYKFFFRFMKKNLFMSADLSIPLGIAQYQSLRKILKHYNLPQGTIIDQLKQTGVFGIYVISLDTWLADESPDLAVTTEMMDSLLRKGEVFLERYK